MHRRGKAHGGCCALSLLGLVACVAGLMIGDDVHIHAAPGVVAFAAVRTAPTAPATEPSGIVCDGAALRYPDGESVAVSISDARWEQDEHGSFLVLELMLPEVGERTGVRAELRARGVWMQQQPPAWSPGEAPGGPGEDQPLDFDALVALLADGGIGLPSGYAGDCLRCGKPGEMHGGENGLCIDCSDELVYGSEPVADTPRLLRAAVRRELQAGKLPEGLTGAGPWYVLDGHNAWVDSLVPEMREVLGPRGRSFEPALRPGRGEAFTATTSARVDGALGQVADAAIPAGMLAFIVFGIGAVAMRKSGS